jgi:tetratricopeptide (TPR) repeat protein
MRNTLYDYWQSITSSPTSVFNNLSQRMVALVGVLYMMVCTTGCRSMSEWESRFEPREKPLVLYQFASTLADEGMSKLNHASLQRAQADLMFLVVNYQYADAKKKIAQIDSFYIAAQKYLRGEFQLATKRNDSFAAVGNMRQLVKLFPDDPAAKKFLSEKEPDIKKQTDALLREGKSALASKDFTQARKNFQQVLLAYPENEEAQSGLQEAERTLANIRRAEQKRLEEERKPEPPPAPLPVNKDEVYAAAVAAFEVKDYLKAKDLFLKLGDRNFRDARLYMQRTDSKIKALGLRRAEK